MRLAFLGFFLIALFLIGKSRADSPPGSEVKLLKRAEQGNIMAEYLLAQLYEKGLGVEKNDARAAEGYAKIVQWFEYVKPNIDPSEYTQSCNYLERCYLHIMAIKKMAEMYRQGKGVAKNDKEAVRLMILAVGSLVNNKDPYAYHNSDTAVLESIGDSYYDGVGVEQDKSQAAIWYERAVQSENSFGGLGSKGLIPECLTEGYYNQLPEVKAKYKLARMYETAEGVEADFQKAQMYYEMNAMLEHADSNYRLGLMYEEGRGLAQDMMESFERFQRAANYGHAEAWNRVKQMILNDPEKYFHFFRAQSQTSPIYGEALFIFGRVWNEGLLTSQGRNPGAAYAYFRVAQEAGYEPAAALAEELKKELSEQGGVVWDQAQEQEKSMLDYDRQNKPPANEYSCQDILDFEYMDLETGRLKRDTIQSDPAANREHNLRLRSVGDFILARLQENQDFSMNYVKDGKFHEAHKSLVQIEPGAIKSLLLWRQLPVPAYSVLYDEYLNIHANTLVTGSGRLDINHPEDVTDLLKSYFCDNDQELDSQILNFSDLLFNISVERYKRGDTAYTQQAQRLTAEVLDGSYVDYSWRTEDLHRCFYYNSAQIESLSSSETDKSEVMNRKNPALERYALLYKVLAGDYQPASLAGILSEERFVQDRRFYFNMTQALLARKDYQTAMSLVDTITERRVFSECFELLLKALRDTQGGPELFERKAKKILAGGRSVESLFTSDSYYKLVRYLYESGKKKTAFALVLNWLKIDPEDENDKQKYILSIHPSSEQLLDLIYDYESPEVFAGLFKTDPLTVRAPDYYKILRDRLEIVKERQAKERRMKPSLNKDAPEMDSAPDPESDFVEQMLFKIDPRLDFQEFSFEDMIAWLTKEQKSLSNEQIHEKRIRAIEVLESILLEEKDKLQDVPQNSASEFEPHVVSPKVLETYSDDSYPYLRVVSLELFLNELKFFRINSEHTESLLSQAQIKARNHDFKAAMIDFQQAQTDILDALQKISDKESYETNRKSLYGLLYSAALRISLSMALSEQKNEYTSWISKVLDTYRLETEGATYKAMEFLIRLLTAEFPLEKPDAVMLSYRIDGSPDLSFTETDEGSDLTLPDSSLSHLYRSTFGEAGLNTKMDILSAYNQDIRKGPASAFPDLAYAAGRQYLEDGNLDGAEDILIDVIDIPRFIFTAGYDLQFSERKDTVLLALVQGLCEKKLCQGAGDHITQMQNPAIKNEAFTFFARKMIDQGRIDEARNYAANFSLSFDPAPSPDGDTSRLYDLQNMQSVFVKRISLFEDLSMKREAQYYLTIVEALKASERM